MSEIYFIRHGQASFGSENYDRLSPKGLHQARILGQHLAKIGVQFDALYSGGMERQRQTAKAVTDAYREKGAQVPEPLIDAAWDEIDSMAVWNAQVQMMLSGEPALLDEFNQDPGNKKAFQKVFSRVMERWVSGEFDARGVETWNTFKTRVVQGLNHVMETWGPAKKIAVFSSGGPISIAAQAALDLSDQKTLALLWQMMNASITRLKFGSQKMTLFGFNDVTHLELTGDNTLLTYR